MNSFVIFTLLVFLYFQINIISPDRIGSIRNEADLGIEKHIKTEISNKKNPVISNKKNPVISKKTFKNNEYIQVIEEIEEDSNSFEEGELFRDKKEISMIKRNRVISKLNRDECVLVCTQKNKNKKESIFSKNIKINPSNLSKKIHIKKEVKNRYSSDKISDEIKDLKSKTKADIEVENTFEIIKKLNVTSFNDKNNNYKESEKNCYQPANRVICKILAHHGANSKISENRLLFNCCCDFASEKLETEFCQNYQQCVLNRRCQKNSKLKNVAREFFKKLKEE